MIERDSPVTEDELHAYVDGELAADRRPAVEAWLASHPDDAARVETWRAQAETIRVRYGGVINEPVPARFDLDRLTRSQRSWGALAIAASFAAFLIGGLAGWFAHGVSTAAPAPGDVFTNEALSAHKLYVTEVRHPIEVKAAEQHLLPWLSRRVGTTLRPPDLAGFDLKLLGGRLLPGPKGPAALFMYEGPTGERYTIYCARTAAPPTALRYNFGNEAAAVHWIETDYGYAVSGPPDRDRLLKVAQSAYEQMEQRAPARAHGSLDQVMPRRGS